MLPLINLSRVRLLNSDLCVATSFSMGYCNGQAPVLLTFLPLHVGVGDEPGARGGEDGRYAELPSAGLAGRDLGRRLGFAAGHKRRSECGETAVRQPLHRRRTGSSSSTLGERAFFFFFFFISWS